MYKEFLEIVGNGSPTGSVLEETIAVSVTISINVEKMTQPNPSPNSSTQQNERSASRTRSPRGKESRVVECLDGLARITLKELAPIHSVKSGTLQNACSTRPKSGCRFGEKFSHAHRQVEEQPSKRSKKEW